jgi:Amt family ammonium transporter
MASGVVAGLVGVTPAAGHVQPLWAMLIGVVTSVGCYAAVQLKAKFGYDDALDAFGVHGVGGLIGALATGVFCFTPVVGLALGGGAGQLGLQALGAGAAIGYAMLGTLLIGGLLRGTMGLRVSDTEERDGLDLSLHGERGYHSELI